MLGDLGSWGRLWAGSPTRCCNVSTTKPHHHHHRLIRIMPLLESLVELKKSLQSHRACNNNKKKSFLLISSLTDNIHCPSATHFPYRKADQAQRALSKVTATALAFSIHLRIADKMTEAVELIRHPIVERSHTTTPKHSVLYGRIARSLCFSSSCFK